MKEVLTGFTETVENDAIALRDEFFVRLTNEVLDAVSKRQGDSEQNVFIDKWKPFVGEKVMLYDANDQSEFSFVGNDGIPYILDEANEDADFRITEKLSLTRTAARKLALYLYHGTESLDNIGFHCSVAMMVYIRNGFDKVDFWKQFRHDMAEGLGELLDGKSPFTVDETLYLSLYDYGKSGYVTDLRKESCKMAKRFPKKAFHIYNDDLIKAIEDNVGEEEYNWPGKECLGQYVVVEDTESGERNRYKTVDKLVKHEGILFVTWMDIATNTAMSDFDDQFFLNECDTDELLDDFCQGIALYVKNGKTADDFWKDFCKKLYEDEMNRKTKQENKQ